ncbi:MAG: hypothetical protein ABR923_17775 [Terracidiphilus sp.]
MPIPVVDPNNPITIFQVWLKTGDDLNGAKTLNQHWDHYNPPNKPGSIAYNPTGLNKLVDLLQKAYPNAGMDANHVAQWQDLSQALAELD